MTMDLERGTMRQWVIGRDGVKRWADTNEPVQSEDTYRWRPDWLRSALARRNALRGSNHDNQAVLADREGRQQDKLDAARIQRISGGDHG